MTKPNPKLWTSAAAQLGKIIPAERLHPRVRAWIETQGKDGEPWTVAVSGGSDSVALLLLLWAHFPKQRKKIIVFHFDHGLRPESAADALFVKSLAKNFRLGFATAQRTPGGPVSESTLREARWKFFREQLTAHQGRVIFFGHQRDDIAETMLMRLARGSSASGLCAPRPARDFPDGVVALRPLLDLERAELGAALKISGATWREDSSNAQAHFLRNRIRHHVLPVWRVAEGARDLNAGVARARALLDDDAEALEALTAEVMHVMGDLPPGEPLPLAQLKSQPRAICRRVLWWWLGQNGVEKNLNATAFDTLLEAMMSAQPGRWSAGPGRWLVSNKNGLSLIGGNESSTATWEPLTFKPGQTLVLPDGAQLATRVVKVDRKLLTALSSGKINPTQRTFLALPGKTAQTVFHARLWQPGDRYRPLGAPGRRKLQDLFTDKKISFTERRRLPVVCNKNHEPLWAPGLPPAHEHRITPATHTALELTYCPTQERIERLTHP